MEILRLGDEDGFLAGKGVLDEPLYEVRLFEVYTLLNCCAYLAATRCRASAPLAPPGSPSSSSTREQPPLAPPL